MVEITKREAEYLRKVIPVSISPVLFTTGMRRKSNLC